MKCNYCGAENKEGSKFCASCGAELKEKKKAPKKEEAEVKEEKVETKPIKSEPVVKEEVEDGKGTASLVLGIISMVVWCVTPITSIIGLILGICAKKSGKKVAGIILNAIALTISVVCLLFCFWFGAVINAAIERVGNSGEFERFFEIIEEEYEKAEKEVESEEAKEENKSEETNESDEVVVEEGKMIIGDDTYGYVQVPSDWKEFKDIDGNSSIQYTDIGDMGYIISLNTVDESVSPYTAATNIKNHIISENADAKVVYTKISKYYGYKVEAKYPDGTYLDAYLFKTYDGKLHYISIEGPDKDSDNFKIPDTFSINK